ncbi:cysteine desulfurase [Myxococcota bacterium]|nr:cysteine desulfurase [Myxococcota bacterium]
MFLDNAASTPVDPAVAARMDEVQRTLWANPSSVHVPGARAMREVERARVRIAERIGASPEEVHFTSGGTEANNLALKGAVWATSGSAHLVVSCVEHPSVLEVAAWLEGTGQARVTRLPVGGDGRVSVPDVEAALSDGTTLVSVMHVNNETGAIQPIGEIGRLCRQRGVVFHSDSCQGFLKARLDVAEQGLDLLTLNAHKVHGPKGVGALFVRRGVPLAPLLHGGGHEGGLRAGTLNVPGIAGFGEAVARFGEGEAARMGALRDRLLGGLRRDFPRARVHGPEGARICGIVNFALPGIPGKWLFQRLDARGIQVSASSACHSASLTPSPVLKAMGLTDDEANEALRVSIGRFTGAEEIDRFLEALREVAAR